MPAIVDTNQIGKREDLSDLLYLAAVTETPFMSAARKGKHLDRTDLYEYQAKKLGDRKSGGVPDGQDIQAFDADPPRALLYGRATVYRRAPMVGFIAQGNLVAGVTDEFSEAVSDQIIEMKKDMEKECYADQDSTADVGNGSKFRGLGYWINDVANTGSTLTYTDTATVPPTAFRTPTAQIFTGSIGDGITTGLTEAAFTLMAQNRWDQIGQSTELMLFCGVNIKNRVGVFSRYTPNITGATPVVRTMTADYDGGEFFGQSVDVFKTDYGTFVLMPVNTEYMPDSPSYRAYGLDMKQVEIRDRYILKRKELPDMMGGPRLGLESIISPQIGDPRSHIKIAGTA